MDNTDKQIKANADKQIKVGGFVEFLKAKKARDGKLNKLGEWLLSKGDTGLYIREEDMKYILK